MLKLLTTIPLEDNILYRMLTAAVPDQTWPRAMWRLMREIWQERGKWTTLEDKTDEFKAL